MYTILDGAQSLEMVVGVLHSRIPSGVLDKVFRVTLSGSLYWLCALSGLGPWSWTNNACIISYSYIIWTVWAQFAFLHVGLRDLHDA